MKRGTHYMNHKLNKSLDTVIFYLLCALRDLENAYDDALNEIAYLKQKLHDYDDTIKF